jgi:malic enzyme
VKCVFSGAGAGRARLRAAAALELGVKPEHILCDTQGVVYEGRTTA